MPMASTNFGRCQRTRTSMLRPGDVRRGTATQAAEPGPGQPLLLRVLGGERASRPPVWLMRQAGRYMKAYQDLVARHPSFRERSENAALATEISLQPWRAFRPDGVILFSDILTPLAGMGIGFDIVPQKGPVIHSPIRTLEAVDTLYPLVPEESMAFVGETLGALREEVGADAAVLGFVGAPFTLASYVVEGGSSKNFSNIKRLMFTEPAVLHALLTKVADAIATYAVYQADCGAQAVQIFDSWAACMSPSDFDVFAGPYLRYVIQRVKEKRPHLPIILYIAGSGALVERMAACGPDAISLCHTVDLREAAARLGSETGRLAFQGNVDPGVLFGSHDAISQRLRRCVHEACAEDLRHILNLGHGILPGTPESSVAHFFEEAKSLGGPTLPVP